MAKLQTTISDLRSNLSLAIDAVQMDAYVNSYQKLSMVEAKVDSLIARSLNLEDIEILRWLSPLRSQAMQGDNFSRRHEGTGHWLLESPQFRSWLQGNADVLWCPGLPGAGKTILASIVVDRL